MNTKQSTSLADPLRMHRAYGRFNSRERQDYFCQVGGTVRSAGFTPRTEKGTRLWYTRSICASVKMVALTSLRCRWHVRATQCLAPTVSYTDVDGQCDKLVTDNGHQFTTPTVHLSWQHLRRPFHRYGWCPQPDDSIYGASVASSRGKNGS